VNNRARAMTRARKRPVAPVSMMTQAPVSIGNTISGLEARVVPIPNGIRVTGRDMIFTTTTTASNAWTLVGGMPLTPSVMFGSAVQNYVRCYGSWRFIACAFHYIASSPTSAAGQVMMYTQKTRSDPMINWASTTFVPFVMTDPGTTLGPVWTNHTSTYKPEPGWRSTDYLLGDDLNDEAAGDIFCFEKSGATSLPGFVLMDYIIEFRELSANPKRSLLPLERTTWVNVALGRNAIPVTLGGSVAVFPFNVKLDGSASVEPPGASIGDIYKVVIDSTNSIYGTANVSNLLQLSYPGGATISIVNGFTVYAVKDNNSGPQFTLFPSLATARSGTCQLVYGLTTGSLTFALQVWMCLVDGIFAQSGI